MVVSICFVFISEVGVVVAISLEDDVVSPWGEHNRDVVVREGSSHFISFDKGISEIDEWIGFRSISL